MKGKVQIYNFINQILLRTVLSDSFRISLYSPKKGCHNLAKIIYSKHPILLCILSVCFWRRRCYSGRSEGRARLYWCHGWHQSYADDYGILGFQRLDRYGNIGCWVSSSGLKINEICGSKQFQRKILYLLRWNNGELEKFCKGQIISERIYEVIVSPKIQTKNCQDFCPV